MHHHFAVINVRTRERLPQDEVLVVGISSLTEKIIEKYGENVVAIFSDAVSNTELSGSDRNHAEYMGKPVFCLTELTKFHQNIVVASHNGLVTMVNKITLDLGITNEIYGVVDDLLLDEIISSIPMFSDYDKTIMQEPE